MSCLPMPYAYMMQKSVLQVNCIPQTAPHTRRFSGNGFDLFWTISPDFDLFNFSSDEYVRLCIPNPCMLLDAIHAVWPTAR